MRNPEYTTLAHTDTLTCKTAQRFLFFFFSFLKERERERFNLTRCHKDKNDERIYCKSCTLVIFQRIWRDLESRFSRLLAVGQLNILFLMIQWGSTVGDRDCSWLFLKFKYFVFKIRAFFYSFLRDNFEIYIYTFFTHNINKRRTVIWIYKEFNLISWYKILLEYYRKIFVNIFDMKIFLHFYRVSIITINNGIM